MQPVARVARVGDLIGRHLPGSRSRGRRPARQRLVGRPLQRQGAHLHAAPTSAPVSACVVEIGSPSRDASSTVPAAPSATAARNGSCV